MKQLYLIGFMGSGKSTVGQYTSEKLNVEYVDLDMEIERIQRKKIVDIFREEGEETFRTYETETLKAVWDKVLVATGGGVVEREENIRYMKEKGKLIYLKTSFTVIQKRLRRDHSRPLWKDTNQNEALFNKRTTLYEQVADYVIICDDKSLDEIVEEIVNIYTYNGFLSCEE
ncbi:shikimate kinase [Ornithinibacillus sp. 179-J 7C1 HS]|uniref:shikimate kinase n=1 Tax=Ornithinibacillus sp. 179-J 7C1 HS TaxID=3142384 RepID=UPI0039A27BAA